MKSQVSSIEISLTAWDLARPHDDIVMDAMLNSEPVRFPSLCIEHPSETIQDGMHDAYKEYLVDVIWPKKLALILALPQLKKLVIGVENAHCVKGCCVLKEEALALVEEFAYGMPKQTWVRRREEYPTFLSYRLLRC